MRKKRETQLSIVAVAILIFILFSVFYCFADETITLTTYYPAPYGIYKELRANGMAIGIAYRHTPAALTDGVLIVSDSVGIGTNDPGSGWGSGAKLNINGSIFQSDSNISTTILYHRSNESGNPSGTSDGFRIRFNNDFFAANYDALVIEKTDSNQVIPDGGIAFVNTGSNGVKNTAMVIRGSGNVGIGTNSPLEDLHVFRGDTDVASIYATGSNQGSGYIYAGQSTSYGGGFLYDGDNNPVLVGGTDRITFFRRNNSIDNEVFSYKYDSNNVHFLGNVGIGTASPEEALDVSGNVYLRSNELIIEKGDGLEIGRNDTYCDENDCYYIAKTDANSANPDGDFDIGERGNDNVFHSWIHFEGNSGCVGIGTEDPRSKLDVRGSSNTCVRVNYSTTSGTKTCPPDYYIAIGSIQGVQTYYQYWDSANGVNVGAYASITHYPSSGYFICCRACIDSDAAHTPDGVCGN